MKEPQSRNWLSGRSLRRRDRRGTATVEFALAAPFLFALLLGMIDVGQLANVGQAVSGASSLGARQAAKPTIKTAADVETCMGGYLADRFPGLSDTALASAFEVSVLDSAGNALPEEGLSLVQPGSAVTVQVVFQFDSVRWLSGVGIGQGKTLNTTTVVRRE